MATNKPSKKKRQRVEKRYEFEYREGSIYDIPQAVTHLRLHPSVTEVKMNAFKEYPNLKEVVLMKVCRLFWQMPFAGVRN